MALSARIGADFSEFKAALANVQVTLGGLDTAVKSSGRELNKWVKELDGFEVKRNAEVAAEAFARLRREGVTPTVEAQAKVNAAVMAGIEQYRAMGQAVPAHLQKVATETTNIQSGLSAFTTALGPIGPMIAGAFTVGAVKAFATDLLNSADQLQKLADRTGMTAEQVQRLQYVGSQTGVSLEGMTGAVQNLQQRLGDGDAGAVGAMKKLGINTEQFMAMNPYAQFITVSESLAEVDDKTTRASLAADVFGKSWKELAPAIRKDIADIADAAATMSNDTVATLDEAGDALDRYKNQFKVMAAEIVVGADRFQQAMSLAIKGNTADAGAILATGHTLKELYSKDLPDVARSAGALVNSTKPLALSLEDADAIAKELAHTYDTEVKPATEALEQADKHTAQSMQETAEIWRQVTAIRASYGQTASETLRNQTEVWFQHEVSRLDADDRNWREHYDALRALADERIAVERVNMNTLRRMSIDYLMERLAIEQNTLSAMMSGVAQYSRDTIDHQREIVEAAKEAAYGMGDAFEQGSGRAAQATRRATESMRDDFARTKASADAAAESVWKLSMGGQTEIPELSDRDYGGDAGKEKRLREIEDYYRMYPGAKPGGSGETGVGRNDADGYRRMLAMQVEYAALKKYLRREMGGPVSAGTPYLVGEAGPEVFVPRQSGGIVPNHQLPAVGGITLHVHVTQPLGTPSAIASVVGDAIVSRLRQSGVRLPVGV